MFSPFFFGFQTTQDKAAESPAMLPAPRSESSLRVLENKAPEDRRWPWASVTVGWMDRWMDVFLCFFLIPQGQRTAGIFFFNFSSIWMDGFWIQKHIGEEFGLLDGIFLVYVSYI